MPQFSLGLFRQDRIVSLESGYPCDHITQKFLAQHRFNVFVLKFLFLLLEGLSLPETEPVCPFRVILGQLCLNIHIVSIIMRLFASILALVLD
jgi:hypothetical protein